MMRGYLLPGLLTLCLSLVGCRRLESIEVGPANAEVAKTTSLKLTATGVYSDGTRQDLSARVEWATDDEKVLSVSAGGEATGRALGLAMATARYEEELGSAPVRVTATPLAALAIVPARVTVSKGELAQLAAFATDTEGLRAEVTGQASWSADGPAVTVMTRAGSVKGASPGTATVTATFRGKSASAPVEVETSCEYADLERFVPPVGSVESRERKSFLEVSQLLRWRSPATGKHEAELARVTEAARAQGLAVASSKQLQGPLFELELACGPKGDRRHLRLPSAKPCTGEEKAVMELKPAADDPSALQGVSLLEFKFDEKTVEELVAARRKLAIGGVDPLGGLPIIRPEDVAGPCNKPHYGVGRFVTFGPVDRRLAKPAQLSIEYTRAEAALLDTSSMALYRWSDASRDWEHVPGDHRPGDRTVSAQIDRLGTYTLAPSMPSGTIVLDGRQNGSKWAFSSQPLRTNDGRPVPDGTVYTVVSFRPWASTTTTGGTATVTLDLPGRDWSAFDSPEGTFITPDASATERGHQVLSRGGKLRFEIRYAQKPAQLVVFSAVGTALGSFDVPPRR